MSAASSASGGGVRRCPHFSHPDGPAGESSYASVSAKAHLHSIDGLPAGWSRRRWASRILRLELTAPRPVLVAEGLFPAQVVDHVVGGALRAGGDHALGWCAPWPRGRRAGGREAWPHGAPAQEAPPPERRAGPPLTAAAPLPRTLIYVPAEPTTYLAKGVRYLLTVPFHENLPLDTPPLAAGRKAGPRTGCPGGRQNGRRTGFVLS